MDNQKELISWKKNYNDCIRKYFPTSPNNLRANFQCLFFRPFLQNPNYFI